MELYGAEILCLSGPRRAGGNARIWLTPGGRGTVSE